MATARLVFLYVHTKLTEEPAVINGSCSVATEVGAAPPPDAPHVKAEGGAHFPPAHADTKPSPAELPGDTQA
jgi:hypothetical protein